jgi:branched-chain amino acid transport system ATP-binding protein
MELAARAISVRFGGLLALDNVTLHLKRGEILGLIGPNGAGKTTFVNVLSGFQRPRTGAIEIGGADCTRLSRHAFSRTGVARTFQAVRLFKDFSVSENVEVAYVAHGMRRAAARRRASEIIVSLGLGSKAHHPAHALSYGDERRVGLARALAAEPQFLLLDEPAAGLAAAEADEVRHLITEIRNRHGCGVLVIEHNMALVMSLCERIQVLDGGRTIASGSADEILVHPEVRRAYLGSSALQ